MTPLPLLDATVSVRTLCGVVATLIFAAAVLPAAWGVFRGRLWASPITWTTWAALGVSAFVSTVRLDAGPVAIAQTAALGVAAIAMAAAAVGAAWVAPTGLGRRLRLARAPAPDEAVSWQRHVDVTCGLGAAVAFVALFFATPETVIWLTIWTDFIAFVPTMVGAWRSPGDQPFWMFFWVAISVGITVIVSAQPGRIIEVIYLVYVVAQQFVMVAIILGRERWASRPPRPVVPPRYVDPPTVPILRSSPPMPWTAEPGHDQHLHRTMTALDRAYCPPVPQ